VADTDYKKLVDVTGYRGAPREKRAAGPMIRWLFDFEYYVRKYRDRSTMKSERQLLRVQNTKTKCVYSGRSS
jgi:hypothetical protein